MTHGPVRLLVVDDDFRVARVHADLAARVDGIEVVGVARTAAEATALAATHRPDLVLLDEYLPDERGSSLMRRLDAAVIVVSADDDAEAVRRAVARGAVNVVLKPFLPSMLTARLNAFVRFHRSLDAASTLDQVGVDRALAMLHEGNSQVSSLPKGRSAVTADAIRKALRAAPDAMTAAEVAEATGVSRATAQRYLSDLTQAGKVELGLRYGTTGRPEHRYTWHG